MTSFQNLTELPMKKLGTGLVSKMARNRNIYVFKSTLLILAFSVPSLNPTVDVICHITVQCSIAQSLSL